MTPQAFSIANPPGWLARHGARATLGLLWVLSSGTARAEAPEQRGPAAVETPPSGDTPELRRAREITAQATVRFQAGDYGAAAASFLEAYDLLDGDPRRAALLNNIAVSYERSFRYDLAMVYYPRYLRESQPDEADRAEVQQIVAGLRELLGEVNIRSNVPARVWIGTELQVDTPATVWVPAGNHVLEARARGYEPSREELRVAPRTTHTLDLTLSPLPQYHGIPPHYFWAGVGLTAAALVTGTAFGARAVRQHRQAEERVDEGLVTPADNHTLDRLKVSADVCFGAAALFGVSTLVLFFVSDLRIPRTDDERPGRVALLPEVGLHGAGLRLSAGLR